MDSSDLGGSHTSRERQESERDAKKARKSSEFFGQKERERAARRLESRTSMPSEVPEPGQSSELPLQDLREAFRPSSEYPPLDVPDYDPDLDDYRQARPSVGRQLSPIVDDPAAEANEREAKRQRLLQPEASVNYVKDTCDVEQAVNSASYLVEKAVLHYEQHEEAYLAADISKSEFLFGFKRNLFHDRYEAMAATATKKKGRKELKLTELDDQKQELFTGPGGSDEREWKAWLSNEACEVLDLETSRRIRAESPSL